MSRSVISWSFDMLNAQVIKVNEKLGYVGRGRNAGYPAPPAQIRTWGITSYGSYLGSWRQTSVQAKDVVFAPVEANSQQSCPSAPKSYESFDCVFWESCTISLRFVYEMLLWHPSCSVLHGKQSSPLPQIGATNPARESLDAFAFLVRTWPHGVFS